MAYNGRTGNYTGAYPAGYGYQTPYWPQVQQPMMVQQEPNTRTVEVESADSIRAAQETPVGAGQTKMFIGKDDSFILVKAVSMTVQVAMDMYLSVVKNMFLMADRMVVMEATVVV